MLDIEGLNVSVSGAPILRNLGLHIGIGEVVALVGTSGSGKSTLANVLLGLSGNNTQVSAQRLCFTGSELPQPGARAWRQIRGRQIGYVPQDPASSLNPVYRVGRQVREALRLNGRSDNAAAVVQRLSDVGLDDPRYVDRYPHELSGGQRQRILIAIALAGNPSLVVADEPTSALDANVAGLVLDTLTHQIGSGTSLLLITHDLAVATQRADRIVVLDAGEIVESSATQDFLRHPHSAAGRELQNAQRVTATVPSRVSAIDPDPRIAARAVAKRFGSHTALHHADLTVHRGETVAVIGPSGSGKSTLARIMAGLTRPDSGEVAVYGRRAQLVSQNPMSALDPRWTVARIIAESLHPSLGFSRDERSHRVHQALTDVGLDTSFAARRPHELSGGQAQRVALARALAPRPHVVILDEAISALDMTSQAIVIDILTRYQDAHDIAYVFITHNITVARAIAHRIVEVREGRLRELETTPG